MDPLDRLFGEDAAILDETQFRLLLFATITVPLGGGLVSPVLDSLIEPLGASADTIGLMMSALTAPGIVLIPVAGILADRYGRRTLLVPALLLYGVAGLAIPLTTDFRVVLGLRVLQGVAFAGLNPVIITSIGDLYRGSREATAQGLRFMAAGLSLVVFPFVAGSLAVLAWQYPFALYAITVPIALVLYLRFEEPTDVDAGAGGTDGREDADGNASTGAPGAANPGPEEGQLSRLIALARRPDVLAILTARALLPVIWIGFMTYNSIVVVRILGGTPRDAGLLVAAGSLAWAASAGQAGRITSLLGGRFVPLLGANVGMGAGFLLVAFAPGLPAAALGIVLTGVGFGINGPLYRSIITGVAPDSLRGGLVSLGEAFGRITATVTPAAMGYAIAVAGPAFGFGPAVRFSLAATAGVAAAGSVLAVLVAARSAPPEVDGVDAA